MYKDQISVIALQNCETRTYHLDSRNLHQSRKGYSRYGHHHRYRRYHRYHLAPERQ